MLYQWLAVSEERRIATAFYVGMLIMALMSLIAWLEVEGERHDKLRAEASSAASLERDGAARLSDLVKPEASRHAGKASAKPTEAKRVPIERAEEVRK